MATYEDLDDIKEKKSPDDFAGIFANFLCGANIKIWIFLFLSFIFLTSDIFINLLSKVEGMVIHENVTVKGTVVQASLLVLFYIVFDLIIRAGVL